MQLHLRSVPGAFIGKAAAVQGAHAVAAVAGQRIALARQPQLHLRRHGKSGVGCDLCAHALLLPVVPLARMPERETLVEGVAVAQSGEPAAVFAENAVSLGGNGIAFAALGADRQDIFQALCQTAAAVVDVRMLLQPPVFVVAQAVLHRFADLLGRKRTDLIGGKQQLHLRLDHGAPAEALAPLGVGQVIAAELHRIHRHSAFFQERIGVLLNVLKAAGSG